MAVVYGASPIVARSRDLQENIKKALLDALDPIVPKNLRKLFLENYAWMFRPCADQRMPKRKLKNIKGLKPGGPLELYISYNAESLNLEKDFWTSLAHAIILAMFKLGYKCNMVRIGVCSQVFILSVLEKEFFRQCAMVCFEDVMLPCIL